MNQDMKTNFRIIVSVMPIVNFQWGIAGIHSWRSKIQLQSEALLA